MYLGGVGKDLLFGDKVPFNVGIVQVSSPRSTSGQSLARLDSVICHLPPGSSLNYFSNCCETTTSQYLSFRGSSDLAE